MSLYSESAIGSATKYCFLVKQAPYPTGLAAGVQTQCYDSLYANLDKISIDTSEYQEGR